MWPPPSPFDKKGWTVRRIARRRNRMKEEEEEEEGPICAGKRDSKNEYIWREVGINFRISLGKKEKKYFLGKQCACAVHLWWRQGWVGESIAVSKRLFPQTFPLPPPPPPPYFPQIAPSTSCFFEEIPFPPLLFRSSFVSLPFLVAFGFVRLRRESIISPKVHCLKGLQYRKNLFRKGEIKRAMKKKKKSARHWKQPRIIFCLGVFEIIVSRCCCSLVIFSASLNLRKRGRGGEKEGRYGHTLYMKSHCFVLTLIYRIVCVEKSAKRGERGDMKCFPKKNLLALDFLRLNKTRNRL